MSIIPSHLYKYVIQNQRSNEARIVHEITLHFITILYNQIIV